MGEQRLQRALGAAFAVAVAVGATIGVGILRTPGIIVDNAGNTSAALVIWGLGAIYVLLGVNYTAELATAIPRSGGPYAFAERTLGPFSGVIVGWSDFLNGIFSLAFLCVALAEYGIALANPGADPRLLSAAIIVLVTALNVVGIKAASKTQQITSLAKVTALWLFVIACFAIGAPAAPAPVEQPASASPYQLLGMLLAFQIVLGVYTGWRAPSYFAGEAQRPGDVVRGLFIGALAVAATYIAVNLAIFAIVPHETMVQSQLPAADAAGAIASRWGWGIAGVAVMTVIACLSLPSTIQGVMLQTSRGLYAMSRDGLFIQAAARVNRRGAPVVAVVSIGAVSILLVTTSSFTELFAAFAFFGVLNNLLLVAGALRLRLREPDLPRPFKAWLYPWSFVLLLVIDAALFVGFLFTNPLYSALTIMLLALLYALHRWRGRNPPQPAEVADPQETHP